jgi:hypothetical protein
MKKILLLTLAMGFALAWSSVQADAMTAMTGEKEIHNGVTDFSGQSYDSLSIWPGEATGGWVEHGAAGGYREEAPSGAFYNGVTDFSGRTYDSTEIGFAGKAGGWVESTSPGGYRTEERNWKPYNGVTDFSGRAYDAL